MRPAAQPSFPDASVIPSTGGGQVTLWVTADGAAMVIPMRTVAEPASQSLRYLPVSTTNPGDPMAHKTFFSFNYEEDVWRASIIRNCGALNKSDIEFIDASLWEEAEAKNDAAIKKLIDDALSKSTVTAVLIGANTASRPWVQYEIDESVRLRKGLFGVWIYRIGDRDGNESTQGTNPLASDYPVYLWNKNNGAENLGAWVDTAYDAAH